MRLTSSVRCWLQRCCWFAKHSLVLAIAVFAELHGVSATAQVADLNPWSKLAATNNLDNQGNTPFHLKIAFQLYDIVGKPSETGTVEEWWVSPISTRIIIDAPSLHGDESVPSDASPAVVRDMYLVDRLLSQAVHPVPKGTFNRPGVSIKQEPRNFGKTTLNCEKLLLKAPVVLVGAQTLCTEHGSDELRYMDGGTETLARNSIGKFHDTYVAQDLEISLIGKKVITGKVVGLQSIDPANLPPELTSVAGGGATEAAGTYALRFVKAEVSTGKRIHFVEPMYPVVAKVTRRSGSVLLMGTIGKDGAVSGLVPLASSDVVFDDSAMSAVRQWKYSPFVLKDQPIQVETFMMVNFSIYGGR